MKKGPYLKGPFKETTGVQRWPRNICVRVRVCCSPILPYSCTWSIHVSVHAYPWGRICLVGMETPRFWRTLDGWPHPSHTSHEMLLAPSDFLPMCVAVLSVHLSITPSLSIYHVDDDNYPPKRPLPLHSSPSSQSRRSAGSTSWASRLNMAFPVKDMALPLTSSTFSFWVVELGDFPLHLIADVKSPRWVFRR